MFDYLPFPIFTHTTGMTHFLDLILYWLGYRVDETEFESPSKEIF